MKVDKGTVPDGMAEFAHLQARAGVGGRGRRSPLTRWMVIHQDKFAAMLADKKPGWDEVAAILAEMGLRDGQGKVPTGDRVRKAWWGLQQAKAGTAARRSKTSKSQPSAPSQLALGARSDPVPEPGPVDVQQPWVSLELCPVMPAGTVVGSQDWLAAGSITASTALVAGDVVADPACLILDGGDGDGLAHEACPRTSCPRPR